MALPSRSWSTAAVLSDGRSIGDKEEPANCDRGIRAMRVRRTRGQLHSLRCKRRRRGGDCRRPRVRRGSKCWATSRMPNCAGCTGRPVRSSCRACSKASGCQPSRPLHGLIPIVSRDSALSEAVNGQGIQVDPRSVFGDRRSNGICSRARRKTTKRIEKLWLPMPRATREKFLAEWEDLITSESILLRKARLDKYISSVMARWWNTEKD